MPDSVGDSTRRAGDADIADALNAKRVYFVILLFDEDDLDIVYVGIHRHVILGNVGVHDTPEIMIVDGLFVQRHSDPADHGTHDLARRRLGIQNASGRDGADHTGHPDHAELFVDFQFHKYRRMRVARVR